MALHATNTFRIMKEIEELKKNKDNNFSFYVSESNIMDWYILYKNLDDPRFKDGEYLLHIKLREGYPFVAPEFKWLTPNGRFEVNTKICYNISSYHQEDWSPLWQLRTIILGIMSMFLDKGTKGIGHLEDSVEKCKKYAKESIEYNNNLIKKMDLIF